MATIGTYRINFTDPNKGSFTVEPYTTNGPISPTSATLHPKAASGDTSLLLYGQYVPNYGERINENLVHMLENFAGAKPPVYPTEGQLWYDTGASYPVVASSGSNITLDGNQTERMEYYKANQVQLTLWYGTVSVTDNTPQSLMVLVTGYSVNGAQNTTTVAVQLLNGGAFEMPTGGVGGWLTANPDRSLGRLRVAVMVDDALSWAEVTNAYPSPTAPSEGTRPGDLWFNTDLNQLHVYTGTGWVNAAHDRLPLSGGAMEGPIDMGSNPITYSGAIDDPDVLVPKSYVDVTVADAVSASSSGTTTAITELSARVTTVEGSTAAKVSKDGDNIRGVLTFGADGTATTLTNGIDMKSRAVINPLITWNSYDYLTASQETYHVVHKQYVANAIQQHLTDIDHVEAGYILRQPDDQGLIPGNIYFNDDYSLKWIVSGMTHTIDVGGTSLTLTSDSDAGSTLELRHGTRPHGSTDPNIAVTDHSVRSYVSMYIHDGQPQPTYNDIDTAENDDTMAATKGFVRSQVALGGSGGSGDTAAAIQAALDQHIQDIFHNEAGYIIPQQDGTGAIPGTIFFNGTGALRWGTGPIKIQANAGGNLELTTGSYLGNEIEFKHGSQASNAAPIVAIGQSSARSNVSFHILDGQPQPTYNGVQTAINDDTAGATKGFVRDRVTTAVAGITTVTGVNLTQNSVSGLYTLTIQRSGGQPSLTASMTHSHSASEVNYSFTPTGELSDTLGSALQQLGYVNTAPLNVAVSQLNALKAAVVDAVLTNPSLVDAGDVDVDSVDVGLNAFVTRMTPPTVVTGTPIVLSVLDGTPAMYTYTYASVSSFIVQEPDPEAPETNIDVTYYNVVVEETIAQTFVDGTSNWTVVFSDVIPIDEPHAIINRATLDVALGELTKSSVGLAEVDNTSDANKPVSTAQQAAIDAVAATVPTDYIGYTLVGTSPVLANQAVGTRTYTHTFEDVSATIVATQFDQYFATLSFSFWTYDVGTTGAATIEKSITLQVEINPDVGNPSTLVTANITFTGAQPTDDITISLYRRTLN